MTTTLEVSSNALGAVLHKLMVNSATSAGRAWIITAAWIVCRRGCEGYGNEEGLGQGAPRRQIWYVSEARQGF